MLIPIDRNAPEPIYRQIIDGTKRLIDNGSLKVNDSLPSTRRLADRLGINRSTVVHAYEELQAQGYLSSRPGSYNRVLKRRREVPYREDRKSLISWEEATSDRARRIHRTFLGYVPEGPKLKGDDIINISQLDLDPRLYPMEEFRKSLSHVINSQGALSLDYGSHMGSSRLREIIAKRLRLHGISVSGEEILITNGAQQGIDLVTRLLAADGNVIVESPTYSNVFPLLRFNAAKLIEVPMTDEGMDLKALKRKLATSKVDLIYTIPNFHNPTGITTSHSHREGLLSICQDHRVPLLEDGFEEDMKYFGRLPLPIKSIDAHNLVIYLGTFSKALFPGLRIGWVTAHRDCISRLTALKRFSDLGSGNLVQEVLAEFVSRGFYDLHLKRIHRVFRRRMQLALRMMEGHFPPSARWTRPAGGYTIWVKIPRPVDEGRLQELMSRFGVIVSYGGYYFGGGRQSPFIRISIAKTDDGEIREGLKRLGAVLSEIDRA
jgi:DNA-binding transcriptional MocR family regulator